MVSNSIQSVRQSRRSSQVQSGLGTDHFILWDEAVKFDTVLNFYISRRLGAVGLCVCVWGGGNPYLWDVLSFQKYLFLALLPLHPLFLFLPLSLSPAPVTQPPSTNPTPNPNRPIWLYRIRTVYTSFEMGRYSLLTKQKALKRSLPLLSSPHTHARAGMLYTISRQQGQEERTEMKRKKLPRFQRHVTCSSNKIISI